MMNILFILTLIVFTALLACNKKFRKVFFRKYPNELDALTEAEFYKQFEDLMPSDKEKKEKRWQELIDKAWKTRDFEIELYWKRANYFWLFQVPAFAAYFAINKSIQNNKSITKPDEVFIVICMGVVFSTAWLLINKGSKSWQRHWEMYIDMLEKKYYGPLYQTVGSDKTYSVSKINEIVSASFIVVWILLGLNQLTEMVKWQYIDFKIQHLNSTVAFSLFFTIIALCSMIFGHGRGYFKSRNITMYKRRHNYENPKP